MIYWPLLLTPFASRCTTKTLTNVRLRYLSYYIFGVRVVHLHLDR